MLKILPETITPNTISHTIAFGQTGGGKTANIIAPALKELFEEKQKLNGNMACLIIDPKLELKNIALNLEADKEKVCMIDGRPNSLRFNPFEGSWDKRLSERVMPIYINNTDMGHSHNASFRDKAKAIMVQFLNLAEQYYLNTGNNIFQDVYLLDNNSMSMKDFNFFDYMKYLIDEIPNISTDIKTGPKENIIDNLVDFARTAGVQSQYYRFLNPLRGGTIGRVASEQWFYYISYYENFLTLLTDSRVKKYCSVEPLKPTKEATLYDKFREGYTVIYQTDPTENTSIEQSLIGKFIKSIFYKYTFVRSDKNQLCAYVCDEFHRFITLDNETGEHNFLDRCRSNKVICILASQSIEAIENNINTFTNESVSQKVKVLLNNVGNKYFFRSSDIGTQQYIEAVVQTPPSGGPKVTNVRPLTVMETGQCYYFKANGDWGIKQFKLNPSLFISQQQAANDDQDDDDELYMVEG